VNVYGAINQPVLERIPRDAASVLDLGCGDGALGRALKARQPVRVVGVTFSTAEAELARRTLDRVETADLESANLRPLGKFDCVVASHVLEHLRDPLALLGRLRDNLGPEGTLLVALPNALHYRQRLAFAAGRFRYTDGGIMDRTHYRFFDWDTARALVRDAGFRLVGEAADGTFPASRFFGPARRSLDRTAMRWLPGLFGGQFVLSAHLK
jgi:2-polyprenyl-3-methyl-5-hydroxy-6-metoxy-1,4-benzoquinol methylase